MNELREQIHALLREGRTEAALDVLLQGAKTRYENLYDEAILLRARWEKIERDNNQNLLSPEDAMRQTNRVNADLLALLDNVGADQTAYAAPVRPQNWRMAAILVGMLLLATAIFFWWKKPAGAVAGVSENPAAAAAAVDFPKGKAVTVVESGEEVRYEIIEAIVDKVNGDEQRLTVRLLCAPMLSPRRGMNFWSANFRFEPAGKPALAPANNLNLIAESHASTEGEVQFVLPAGVRGGKLWMKYLQKEADLELTW